MATWLVGGAVVLIASLTAWKMIRDKKNGKSSCGGDCAHCHCCHSQEQ